MAGSENADHGTKTLPRHVAIIMDGNNRWAKARGMAGIRGHHAGADSVRAVIRRAAEQGVEALTLFAFSSENWRRPPNEVNALMELFMLALKREVSKLHRNSIRLNVIGERSRLSSLMQHSIARSEARTRDNTGLQLNVAINYGGKWDIAQAARRLAEQVADGTLSPDQIDEDRLGEQVCMAELPEVDLLIRTSGEQRISNFLLWQVAYAELYFTPCYWPDFGADAFDEALEEFSRRVRRFGMTNEQIGVKGA